MAYSFKKKRYCVRQTLLGITPTREICRNRNVPKTTLYRWIEAYKAGGWQALKNKPVGAPPLEINPQFEELVVNFWKDHKYGSGKTWFILKEQGYNVSQRQIQKIFNKHGFRMNRRRRPNQITYRRYERDSPNELWHTDWSCCPFTGKNIIAFIDDYSRYVIHAEIFERQTTEDILIAFEKAINKSTIPPQILTDNGVQFTPACLKSKLQIKQIECYSFVMILCISERYTKGIVHFAFVHVTYFSQNINILNSFTI